VFAWLDPKRLKQILLNLLGNAVKFTPEGGSVSLEVHADAKGKVLRFAVRDTGPGIASQDMSRLFQPFSQLDTRLSREHEGSGLGLMIVRRMVDMLQGSVTVESELGRGSCFTVALPWQLSERPSRQEIVVSSRLPPQSQRERILLVEDNENNIALMTEYLQIAGYRVQIARNGHEALDRAVEFMPELILMDIQLPRLDGLEVTRRLRQLALFRTTPLIVVTALVMPGDCERCLAAGANDYLSKPVSLEDLAAKIRAMLAAASVGGSNGS
jgi:CheY-like chemotaxis protein/anti-sigma regulatory factor (Ser/Thr protein kinase)